MRANLQFLRRLYGLLLKFYPRNYQKNYGMELQAVFDLSLDEAAAKGGFEIERLILREGISLPGAVLYEHLRERRRVKMTGNFISRFDFAPGTRSEIWAALAPFLLFGALPALLGYFRVSDLVPLWLDIVFVIVLWSFGLSLLLIGFVKRFPRWFMPYIGLPMPVLSLFLFIGVIEPRWHGFPFLYRSSWFVRDFVSQGALWIGLLFLVILLLVSIRYIPASRPFHQRLRDDWTLLAFIIYGTAPFVLVIALNEYKNEEPYLILALLILAAGGWLYLRSDMPWNRFLCLQGGVALSMLTTAAGKAVLVASSFPGVMDDSWQTEFMSTVITWMWLAMIMMIPLAINLLPHANFSRQPG